MNDICAVVATYNRKELLKRCLHGILDQRGAECDIIVIDNGSQDNTEELFRNEFITNKIKYINVGKNLGSAGAQARGIKEAVLQGYKYIWLMDDDVIPNKDALVELVRVDNELDGNWGILSSVAYWTDGEICKPNRQKKTLFRFIKDNDYNKHLVRALMVSAASMYVNADAVKDVGLPIAEYFFYTDDYEFSGRISRKYPVYVVPSSKVTHAIKVNMKANIVKDTQDRMYRYQNLYRNDVHCYRQYGMKGNIYLITKFIYTYMMVLAKEKKYRKQKIDILVKGYHDGLLFKPEIEKL